jgi:hypothetical protein
MKEARRTIVEYLVEPEVEASLARRSLNMCLSALGSRPATTCRHMPSHVTCHHMPSHVTTCRHMSHATTCRHVHPFREAHLPSPPSLVPRLWSLLAPPV